MIRCHVCRARIAPALLRAAKLRIHPRKRYACCGACHIAYYTYMGLLRGLARRP